MIEINLEKIKNHGPLLSMNQDYCWSLVTGVNIIANKLNAHTLSPTCFANFFADLPPHLWDQEVNLSISDAEGDGRYLEIFFNQVQFR